MVTLTKNKKNPSQGVRIAHFTVKNSLLLKHAFYRFYKFMPATATVG
jgi:hypothetical protein